MKKGRSRNKRKKTRSRLLWIAIAVIGMAAVTVAVCVAGMFTKGNGWKTPEELLVEYINHIPKQEYGLCMRCSILKHSVEGRRYTRDTGNFGK